MPSALRCSHRINNDQLNYPVITPPYFFGVLELEELEESGLELLFLELEFGLELLLDDPLLLG